MFSPAPSSTLISSRIKTLFRHSDWFISEKRSPPLSESSQNDSDLEISSHLPLHLRPRTVTGWDRSCTILLLDCTVATLWGIALLLFAMGLVPFNYNISQWGTGHPELINFVITVVASLTTAHTKRLIGNMISQLANYRLLTSFTLRQLDWMQGVREWDIFARFPKRTRAFWVLFWACMGLHTASVASIMQPVKYVENIWFKDTAPCGVQPDVLTLDPMISLSSSDQMALDQSAFAVGLQFGTYYQALRWNTTTTAFGRPYVKENISYGAVGGLHDGLHNTSGVLFDVQCATDEDGQDALNSAWARTFPNRSFPLVQITSRNTSISGSFGDPPVDISSMQSITSSTTFNLTASEMALYSIVDANGNGGLLGVTAASTVACTWLAVPKLVYVILVNWVAHSHGTENATIVPRYVGRGVLATIKGMAQAALTGARLDHDRVDGELYNDGPPATPHMPSTAEMLGVLLADGVRSTLTGFTLMTNDSTVSMCSAQVRTINIHWRFGNEHQLGWIAIIFTPGAGIIGIVVLHRLSRAKRVTGIDGLSQATVFMLGVDSDTSEVPNEQLKDTPLKLQGGRIIVS